MSGKLYQICPLHRADSQAFKWRHHDVGGAVLVRAFESQHEIASTHDIPSDDRSACCATKIAERNAALLPRERLPQRHVLLTNYWIHTHWVVVGAAFQSTLQSIQFVTERTVPLTVAPSNLPLMVVFTKPLVKFVLKVPSEFIEISP